MSSEQEPSAEPIPVGYQPSLEEIFQYLDGQLDEDHQSKLSAHLHQCGGCDDIYNFQAGFKRLLGSSCRSQLPADLPQRVFRAINELP